MDPCPAVAPTSRRWVAPTGVANRPAAPQNATSWRQTIASNAKVRVARHPSGAWQPDHFSRREESGYQRPSGVRTPNQLSRTC